MNKTVWASIFLIQYLVMIYSYGGEILAALVTTSFLFIIALNPYWSNYISGTLNLRENVILYGVIIFLPMGYAFWKFVDVADGDAFEVIVLWGNGIASVPKEYLWLYCLSNLLFTVIFITFNVLNRRVK